MSDRLPLALRQKYSLVHVPSRTRSSRWTHRTREIIADGLPPEHAGLQAAREVFPYEARERAAPGAARVDELITLDEPRDTIEA